MSARPPVNDIRLSDKDKSLAWKEGNSDFLVWLGWPERLSAIVINKDNSKQLYTGPATTTADATLAALALDVCRGGWIAIAHHFEKWTEAGIQHHG